MTLPEEDQATALRRLTTALDRMRAAEAEVWAAAAAAKDANVSVNRIAQLAGVSRGQIYTWVSKAAEQQPAPDE